MSGQKTVKIFIMKQEFPCGEQSSCCGPIGQSAEEIDSLKSSIEKQLGCKVEVLNVKNDDEMKDYPRIVQLVQSLGPPALPILTLDDEVVSMGNATPEKVAATIRENTEKKKFREENRMLENGNSQEAATQESTTNVQPCCSAASDDSCCPTGADGGGGKSWKTLVFVVIVIAAGVVLARSFINKSNSISDQAQELFATVQPEPKSDTPPPPKAAVTAESPTESEVAVEAPSVVNDTTKEEVPDKAVSALWGPELSSLASLNKVAANFDAVFILLGGEDQLKMQQVTKEVEAAAKTIQSGGSRISAFTLKKDAPDYRRLAKQFSIPCAVAMVKGGGASGISGEITETKLIQAFVTASRSGSGCCPGGGGTSGCGPGRAKPRTK